jgi:hypothetical protein
MAPEVEAVSRRVRGKRLLVVSLACAVAVVALFTVTHWERIPILWNLHRLRSGSLPLAEVLAREPSPLEARAVGEFLREPAGLAALVAAVRQKGGNGITCPSDGDIRKVFWWIDRQGCLHADLVCEPGGHGIERLSGSAFYLRARSFLLALPPAQAQLPDGLTVSVLPRAEAVRIVAEGLRRDKAPQAGSEEVAEEMTLLILRSG